MKKDLAEWESFEALEECVRRDTVPVARALHMSHSIVQKWKEQPVTEDDFSQSGARNPLDRIATIISAIEKIDLKRAYLPIMWLNALFGFSAPIKLPDVNSKEDISKALLKWTKEFGETCKTVSGALEDGDISKKEYKDVFREMMEDISAGMSLVAAIKTLHEDGGK